MPFISIHQAFLFGKVYYVHTHTHRHSRFLLHTHTCKLLSYMLLVLTIKKNIGVSKYEKMTAAAHDGVHK